jgi:hypothetical protein
MVILDEGAVREDNQNKAPITNDKVEAFQERLKQGHEQFDPLRQLFSEIVGNDPSKIPDFILEAQKYNEQHGLLIKSWPESIDWYSMEKRPLSKAIAFEVTGLVWTMGNSFRLPQSVRGPNGERYYYDTVGNLRKEKSLGDHLAELKQILNLNQSQLR